MRTLSRFGVVSIVVGVVRRTRLTRPFVMRQAPPLRAGGGSGQRDGDRVPGAGLDTERAVAVQAQLAVHHLRVDLPAVEVEA